MATTEANERPIIVVSCVALGRRRMFLSRTASDCVALELLFAEDVDCVVAYNAMSFPTDISRGIATEVPLPFANLQVGPESTIEDLEKAIATNLRFGPPDRRPY